MNLLKLYGDFMAEKRGYCSDETIDDYEMKVGRFFMGWLSDRLSADGRDLHCVPEDTFCKGLFYDYLSYLRQMDVKNVTVRSYFRNVKSFCGWLYDNDHIARNYCKRIKMPGDDSAVKVPLSKDEVRKIDAANGYDGYFAIRNYCMLHCMLDCGMRLAEVCNLKLSEVDFENEYLDFGGKGYKRRIVPCPGFLLEWMSSYIRDYRPGGSDFLFEGAGGDQVNTNGVKVFIQKLKKKSGVGRLHCHLLRHTFATSYIIGGGNLEYLRMLLGHSDYLITQNYLHCASRVSFINMEIYELDECFFRNVGYRK